MAMSTRELRTKAPELLADMSQQISSVLIEMLELDKDRADNIGQSITDIMAAHWGGQNVYFPMGLAYKLSQRDRQIYEQFNGSNHSELARKYGVSLQWIYRIIKAVRKHEMEQRQQGLF